MSDLQERVVAHHVGARGFGVALNCPTKLARHLLHVVYEADEQCAKGMMAENKDENFHVLSFCLGRNDEPAKLYITRNPFFSSNLKPNPCYGKFSCEVHLHGLVDGVDLKGECYDVDYGGDMSVVRVDDVKLRTLDSILDSGEVPTGLYPDFLSLDTQGSELNILIGAQRAFQDHCLALATEVEFHELYQNQHLFPHIFEFARSHGFHFAGFTYLQEISSNRQPIGARHKGFVAFGDALFLRSIESVKAMGKPKDELYLCLLKLAFISLNFGYLEYAMQVIDAAESAAPDLNLRDRLMARDCYRMLYALREAVRGLPRNFPHNDRIAMTDELKKLQARDSVIVEQRALIARQAEYLRQQAECLRQQAEDLTRMQESFRQAQEGLRRMQEVELKRRRLRYLARTDPLAAAYKTMRYALRAILRIPYADPRVAELLASMPSEMLASMPPEIPASVPPELLAAPPTPGAHDAGQPPSPSVTPVETVLEEYGYSWWADEVRRRRKSAESSVAGRMYR
jgi:Methyltransferase FkbM domain